MEPMTYTWMAVAGMALSLLLAWMQHRYRDSDEADALRKRLQGELRAALAEGRINDAAYLQARLKALGCLLACALLLLAGCRTPPGPAPLIIGERAFLPKAGDVLTVPALKPPAQVWYLIDDVFLAGWLGLDLAQPVKEGGGK